MLSEGDLVRLLCLSGHYRGFPHLLDCVNLAVENVDRLDPVAKKLYPLVAERHGTTVGRVICSIRNLIKVWWKRGNRRLLPDYISDSDKPPGNKAFIYALVAYLQRKQNK